ncbi:FAS-associated death domain protein [Stegastes partitus]|uniref:FAS-associated death domain protein-like n=1 Tax=Stegastes partitus TaxID=144197 RepID=A0A9Y4N516_9TELE|nr:PREDICTED: FAS-associated death domain protein-like [Stegastes partitus]XP_008285149.1 PREDICTED: FAS-associated death domain protein-like [Stegastes partitus]XP_008285150.1 PREDICTED: FAS-associated death domain protein-like [Stegastes partitus]
MAEEPAAEIQLLRRQKTKLIEILSADADFVLQHADAGCLLSLHGYQQVKSCRVPSKKVTELLDLIIQRGPDAARGLLQLLKGQAMQETFPMLCFINDLQLNTLSSEIPGNRQQGDELKEIIPAKKICKKGPSLVNEKQLMTVARAIGRSWREIGRMALNISSVKLEQIEEDHSPHVERVFAMLRYWRTCQREEATAAHLHSLLSQDDWALPPESIDCLLETD